jgi:hypothetical protein
LGKTFLCWLLKGKEAHARGCQQNGKRCASISSKPCREAQSKLDTIELNFYNETDRSKKRLDRLPGAVLYFGGKSMADDQKNIFTEDVAKRAMLISFEYKTNILNQSLLRQAQKEACRDFAAKISRYALLETPVGYSILTDGITWIFLCFRLVLQKRPQSDDKIIVISTERSEDISIMGSSLRGFHFKFDRLAKWLCFVLQQSILKQTMKPQEPFLDEDARKIQLSNVSSFQIFELFDQGRFFVVEGTRKINGQTESSTVVLKIINMSEWVKRRERLDKEQKNLQLFAESDAIVNMVSTDPNTATSYLSNFFLTIENAGTALDKFLVSGDAGKALAEVVKRDIWGRALHALREENYVHTDMHPGNICIKESAEGKGLHATIVDLESAVEVAEIIYESLIKDRDGLGIEKGAKASYNLDKAAVLAILSCLHDDGSFCDLVKKRKSYFEMLEGGQDFVTESEFVSSTVEQ